MTVIPASRVHYFDRQYLRLPEFRDEQGYHISLRRRHNLSHHSWGIVVGLEIALEDNRPVVRPGLAVDGYGRELLVLQRQSVGREVFERLGTTRLDLWLEYELDSSDEGPSAECDPAQPRQRYRAIEKARLNAERAGAAPVDPRHPAAVPAAAADAILPDTPDDPRQRWPVYLGRVVMKLTASGEPEFTIDATGRPYVGLNADIIDHPGNPSRLEIGHASDAGDQREIAGVVYTYPGDPERRFAVFVPPEPPYDTSKPIEVLPTIAITTDGTQIRGTVSVHGDLVLDGTSLLFPAAVLEEDVAVDDDPAIYRASSSDELRIDLGNAFVKERNLAIGLTKDGEFKAALEIRLLKGQTNPTVTIRGDLRVAGFFDSDDIRLRTLSQDLIPQLAAMLQTGILAGQP
jgi:hypothetical protein